MLDALNDDELAAIDAYWRAANYLSVGQIYLLDNPLLTKPLAIEHVKPRLLGHWGTTPGLNFVYAHLNRAIRQRDLSMLLVTGPGHGGPGIVANAYLEGTYTEVYPSITRDAAGMKKLFRQFSFPGGIPSHVAAETPGSIHEGGELGYSLVARVRRGVRQSGSRRRVRRSAMVKRKPVRSRRRGIRTNSSIRAATARCCRSCISTATRSRIRRLLARMDAEELDHLLRGYGHLPYYVEGSDPATMHRRMATILGEALDEIHRIQHEARSGNSDGSAALAGDRAALAERLDRSERGRWRKDRRPLALAPGAVVEHRRKSRASRATRAVAEELSAGGTVRRTRRVANELVATRAARCATARCNAARQRRPAAARPEPARHPRSCGNGGEARRAHRRIDARDGALPARRAESECGRNATSASSAPTKRRRTGWARYSKSLRACGWRRSCRPIRISRRRGA